MRAMSSSELRSLELVCIDCRGTQPGPVGTDAAWLEDPSLLPAIEPPAAAVALDVRTHAAWGRSLTLAQYLFRERVLRASPFSRRGLRAWALQRRGATLASCETYACDVVIGGRGTAPSRATGHGIASVYVDPDQRGHGYASELLRRVHAALHAEGALLCFLWSEIGPTLYQRLGYVARPLSLRRYAAAPKEESHGTVPPWRLLRLPELGPVLAARPLAGRGLAFSIELDLSQIDWCLRRAAFYARSLGRPISPFVAAQAGDALSVFCPDYVDNLMRVLTLYPGAHLSTAGAVFEPRSAEGENLRNVLHAARAVAGQLGLSAIELWQNPLNTGYLRGGAQSPEVKELPMVLLFPQAAAARGPARPPLRADDWQDYERGLWL
jgi:GNAT superfamily N-acetyltransferase